MHTKFAVALTLLMVSSLACACGSEFFAPCEADSVYPHQASDAQLAQVSKRRNGETGVDDQSVKQFLGFLKTMKKADLLGLLNKSGVQLLLNMKKTSGTVE